MLILTIVLYELKLVIELNSYSCCHMIITIICIRFAVFPAHLPGENQLVSDLA